MEGAVSVQSCFVICFFGGGVSSAQNIFKMYSDLLYKFLFKVPLVDPNEI